jgi:hypothetical protein
MNKNDKKILRSPFTLSYYNSILNQMLNLGNIKFITYDDLLWAEENDYKAGYQSEWISWQKGLKSGEIDSKFIYILIQHDSDSGPIHTVDMLDMEKELNVKSSTMIFARWRGIDDGGEVVKYPINFPRLLSSHFQDFCFGYHCNAFQISNFNDLKVFDEFATDIDYLSSMFPVKYFSPHGGKKSSDGIMNASFDYINYFNNHPVISKIRWVHNRFSPKFNGYYSDGGLIGRIHGDSHHKLNLQEFINSLIPGRRYRILVHPQYYSDRFFQPLHHLNHQLPQWYIDTMPNYSNPI